MNYSKITGTTYGKITKKIIAKKAEKTDTDYYIFYVQKTNEENSVNYYPFWWFVPKDFENTEHKSAQEIAYSLIHKIVKVNYEQLPSNDGYIINSINRIDVAQKNDKTQETKFVNVINNFKNWQKEKEKTEEKFQEKVATNDFGTPLNPEKFIEESTIESSIYDEFDKEPSL
ncbi:hypothetical protein [Mycoplasmopsis gallinacea]|uniref:Uncharacterized protein n=1 Tax=Mycoplasmopsis gallinacea TaxID=29556 RepID=A0A6H0V2E1_9BACT|nr:hypothetical protein [Mycoplasmopsis gallinacea]QIW62362.1 hypothetical protein GOQ20_02920 [Mycoplasmopsis gallinacea]